MLQLSAHALAMASVETTHVTRRALARELRAVGKIQYNESSLATVTARVDGYAERLFVNFTGVEIKKGDHLADIYSPDLLVAQQELLIALQGGGSPRANPLVEAASLKLKRWGLTEEQVKALVDQKKITDRVTLLSPISGTVIEKTVVENSAFKAGDVLYRVANLDTVWVYLDIYEYDLAWVRFGQRVDITAEALPGRDFSGMVTFVQPVVTEETRTVRVPVHVENKDHALKPGMFVSALIKASLTASGEAAPTGVEGKFTCPMHPQVLRDAAGKCPVCDMPLERIPGTPAKQTEHVTGQEHAGGHEQPGGDATLPLAVPATAVLDSGTRHIAYVEMSRGLFESREVTLGPRSGEFVPVLKGLAEGERVVTRGGFLVDSQFQITGRPSLFYPGGLAAGAGAGHQHGGGGAAAGSGTGGGAAAPAGRAPEHKH
jgi:Cu(I)/Ag(I) efflux system membrane fusion protein